MGADEEELKSSLSEEFNIMDERSRESRTFSADSFQEPIANLHPRTARTLDESATVGECVQIMREIRHGAIMITRVGLITGIVTERDLMMEVMGNEGEWRARSVTEIMTPNPDTLLMEDPMIFIMNRMHVGRYRHVPIVNDQGEPTHIVSIRDVLRFILQHFEAEVSNIPPEPYRGPRNQWGG